MNDVNKSILLDDIKLIESNLFNYTKISTELELEKDVISAMNYSLSAGGKRLRPVLVLEFCKLCGGNIQKALATACAIEMVHTSSLIHDDLPCMDNDDLRRGKPSCHKQYNEWLALLAGDNLMIKPFEIIANDNSISADTRVKIISILSSAIGYEGMIGGQVLDIQNETRNTITEDILVRTCAKKTGALIESACTMGCLCSETGNSNILYAKEYAKNIGLAFQIIDDILDVTSTAEILGKPIGSDEVQNKITFVNLLGLNGAKLKAQYYTNKAIESLSYFKNNQFLLDLTNHLLFRKY